MSEVNEMYYTFDESWLQDRGITRMLINKNNVCDISFEGYNVSDTKSNHYREWLQKIDITTVKDNIRIKKYFPDQLSAEAELTKKFGEFIDL